MENKIIERNSKDEKVNNKDGILKECRDNDKKLEDINKKSNVEKKKNAISKSESNKEYSKENLTKTNPKLDHLSLDNPRTRNYYELAQFQKKSNIVVSEKDLIGSGGYSSIYLGTQKTNDAFKNYAIKIINYKYSVKDNNENDENKKNKIKSIANNEIIFTYNLKHRYCIKMFGYYTMDNSFGLVVEYASGKDLNYFQAAFHKNIIQKKNNYPFFKNDANSSGEDKYFREWKLNFLSENILLFYSIQIIEVLKLFKEMRIIHRDLKLENIFLLKNFQIKVGDFALAKIINLNETHKAVASGTLIYMSPELFSSKQISYENVFKQDYYAFGMILFKLLTYEFPFDKSITEDKSKFNSEIIIENLKVENLERIINQRRYCSSELKDFIYGLIRANVCSRFNLDEICKHEWINQKRINKIKSIHEKFENDGFKFICELQKSSMYEIENSKSKKMETGIEENYDYNEIDHEEKIQFFSSLYDSTNCFA